MIDRTKPFTRQRFWINPVEVLVFLFNRREERRIFHKTESAKGDLNPLGLPV